MTIQGEMSFADFRKRFASEDFCREYLYNLRWPAGFVCPVCGGAGCCHIKGRSWHQSSGTVMNRSKLSLRTWFWAICLVSRDKRGYSATQLTGELDIACSSARYLLHRIRSAMAARDSEYRLSRIAELDDTCKGLMA